MLSELHRFPWGWASLALLLLFSARRQWVESLPFLEVAPLPARSEFGIAMRSIQVFRTPTLRLF